MAARKGGTWQGHGSGLLQVADGCRVDRLLSTGNPATCNPATWVDKLLSAGNLQPGNLGRMNAANWQAPRPGKTIFSFFSDFWKGGKTFLSF